MTTVLCTLYNSLYLDKGLVLYDSLCECAKDFKLYVLCMDDKCYEVLTELKQEAHIPVRLSDFEAGDEALLAAKANRPIGEYCWTCSSSFIRYVLNHYKEESCTYIDADMYFYNDPVVLINEMMNAGKSVMVVPHRFPNEEASKADKVGSFCVEFNTFLNTPESKEVLEYWRNLCLECCSNLGDGIHWGDQKYLDVLVSKFDCVYICRNEGAGIAPWNVSLYKKDGKEMFYEYTDKNVTPVFYHFQGLKYKLENYVVCGDILLKEKNYDMNLLAQFYQGYLLRIKNRRAFLKNTFKVSLFITISPTWKDSLGNMLRKTYPGQMWALWRLKKSGNAYIVRI